MESVEDAYNRLKLTHPSGWKDIGSDDRIGKGAYGEVFRAQVLLPKETKPTLCAVKRVSKSYHNIRDHRTDYFTEIITLTRLAKVSITKKIRLYNLT